MTDTLYGNWSVKCRELNWGWGDQRFVINGSDSSDGIYDAIPDTEIARVSGPEWSIKIEYNWNRGDTLFYPSSTRKLVSYTVSEGLMITIGASNDYVVVDGPGGMHGSPDYIDTVIICKSLDPTINPKPPDISYNFSISPDKVRQ